MAFAIRTPRLAKLLKRIFERNTMTAPQLTATLGSKEAKEVFRQFREQTELRT